MAANPSIDFVLPWVDNTNPDWKQRFQAYQCLKGDAAEIRYRDWDLLRYWFRGIEQFAPWFRKIHFITSGELPDWINLDHPQLNWVKHEDYIPIDFLPTFSANAIELNLHRLDDLSEQFVYFNDDFFIIKPVSESRFFYKELPCDYAVMTAKPSSGGIIHMAINDLEVVGRHFDKHTTMKNHFSKWFSLKYRKGLINNILLYPWKEFSGFVDPHIPYAFTKSTLEHIWRVEPDVLDATSRNRFRTNNDVNQWLIRYWQLAEGNFYPQDITKRSICIDINDGNEAFICNAISRQEYEIICLNDSVNISDFEATKKSLQQSFEKIVPQKSSFEKY